VHGPTDLELIASDGRLELTVADVPAHVEEQGGFPVIVTNRPMESMSAAETVSADRRALATYLAMGVTARVIDA
jgi:hypothetical protein